MEQGTDGSPSRTAAMVAAYRARASRGGAGLCDDTWAEALAGDLGQEVVREFDQLVPFMELLVAVRTAAFDGYVRAWTTGANPRHLPGVPAQVDPIDQVVVLGAGLDSRGARLRRTGLTFYEVDHPHSLRYKTSRVASLADYPGGAIRYTACDIERDSPLDALVASGFDPRRPALFVSEGLVPYLSEPAVTRMLDDIGGRCHAGSVLLLDHVASAPAATPAAAPPASTPQEQRIADTLAAIGEPLLFGRGDIVARLDRSGFAGITSVSLEEIRRLLTGLTDPVAPLRFQQVTLASRLRREP